MSFTASDVKELREKTGAGMMDCKRALSESGGSMDSAIEFLRKKGLATAAKKSTRAAAEGTIGWHTEGNVYVLVEVNCETDFVTKTEDFIAYVPKLAKHIASTRPADIDALLASNFGGRSVKDTEVEMIAKIGENLGVRRFALNEIKTGQKVGLYMHSGNKIGTMVVVADPNNKLTNDAAREVAMHVAAMSPAYIRKQDVSAEYVAKEKEIYRASMAGEKKPENVIEKIIEGKLAKHMKDVCLEEQTFVKDPEGKKSVGQFLKDFDKDIALVSMVRLQVGEGIEKKKSDLAEEVARMVQ